ncbi:hypothetical protein DXG01_017028 [Tephrocybe rancida]|nr:hypothetical protein DXG01_017028 [Tephrocybe rancida]
MPASPHRGLIRVVLYFEASGNVLSPQLLAFVPMELKHLNRLLARGSIGPRSIEYGLLPLDYEGVIFRQHADKLHEALAKSKMEFHYQPFDTLPRLRSRIRSHFVIVDFVKKLRLKKSDLP